MWKPGIWELLVILAIVFFIFGPKRLKNIGSDLGSAIKGFRKAVTDDESTAPAKDEPKVIEGEAGADARAASESRQDTKA